MTFYNPFGTGGRVESVFLSAHGIAPAPGARIFYMSNSTTLPYGGIAGSNGNSGLSPLEPYQTLFGTTGVLASAEVVASRGDVIVIMPGHSETITAVGTVSKIGVQIIGCKLGNDRPVFTVNGAVDLFSLTAANILLQSLELNIVTTDAAT